MEKGGLGKRIRWRRPLAKRNERGEGTIGEIIFQRAFIWEIV